MRTSPSSLKVFQDCPRKWAFKSQCHLPKIDQPHFAFGTKLHSFAEDWLVDGTPPDATTKEGALFLEGIPHIPRPGVAIVELAVGIWLNEDFSVGGVRIGEGPDPDAKYGFFGFIDWAADLPTGLEVGDHKTSADPKRYGLTPDTLPVDVAAIIYGAAAAVGFDVTAVRLRWVYYNKKKRGAFPVDALVTREDNLIKLKALAPTLDEMTSVAARFIGSTDVLATANAVPNRPAACDGFGRFCDFATYCNIYQTQSTSEIPMAESAAERLEAIKARIQANKEKANAPEAVKQEAAVVAEVMATPVAVAAVEPDETPVERVEPVAPPPKFTRTRKTSESGAATGYVAPSVVGDAPLAKLLRGESVTFSFEMRLS